jgi:DNA-binding MarR family transcriptional regulator
MSYSDDDYTVQDLKNDMESLRKAGLIEIIGITDDGEWLYGATPKSKELLKSIDTMSTEEFNAIMDDLLSAVDDDTLDE